MPTETVSKKLRGNPTRTGRQAAVLILRHLSTWQEKSDPLEKAVMKFCGTLETLKRRIEALAAAADTDYATALETCSETIVETLRST